MLQVYTGNGKGKTTAAIGLAIRSLGAGHRVYMMQFMKSLAYAEQHILKDLAKMTLETTGKPFFIAEEGMVDEKTRLAFGDDLVVFPHGQPPHDYLAMMVDGMEHVTELLRKQVFDLVILDEINVALSFGLVQREQMEALLDLVPVETEVVCTGRNAPSWLQDRADLITNMEEVRHYYRHGVDARKGIEN